MAKKPVVTQKRLTTYANSIMTANLVLAFQSSIPVFGGITATSKRCVEITDTPIGLTYFDSTEDVTLENRIEIQRYEFVPMGSRLAKRNGFKCDGFIFEFTTEESAKNAADLFAETLNVNLAVANGEILNIFLRGEDDDQ
jgi:hypothetical protein